MAGHGPSPAGRTTSAGFPATRADERCGSSPAASTADVSTGVSSTEEITTMARACASTHDQYEIDSPITPASNTRRRTRQSPLPENPSAESFPRNVSPAGDDLV